MEKKQASGEDTAAFYIVGIGASAGGLDSFEKFLVITDLGERVCSEAAM